MSTAMEKVEAVKAAIRENGLPASPTPNTPHYWARTPTPTPTPPPPSYWTAPTATGSTALTATPGATPMSALAASGDKAITGAGNVINSQIDGSAYNKAAGYQNLMADRAEQGQRATSALGIARAGFGGTPMGAYAGNATESTILQNRFDNALALEAARQNSQLEGAKLGVGYANNVADYNENKVRAGNDYISASFDGDPDLRQRVSTATTAEDITRIGQDIAAKYPNIVEHFRALYGRDPTAEDLGNLALNHYKSTSEAYQTTSALAEEAGISFEDAQFFTNGIARKLFNLNYDDKGNSTLEVNNFKEKAEGLINGDIGIATYKFDGETNEDKAKDPVYKEIVSRIHPSNTTAREVNGRYNTIPDLGFDNAGELRVIDGRLYYSVRKSYGDPQSGKTGRITYVYKDAITGGEREFVAERTDK